MRTCFACKTAKPPAAFYANGRNLCRACNRARVKRWCADNPERRKAIGKRYRQSAKGRETIAKARKAWRKLNTASYKAQFARYVANLGDGYVRKLLREMGNCDPTPAQIERHRKRVQAMRARRALVTLNLLNYGA